jgi:hypothetical protein
MIHEVDEALRRLLVEHGLEEGGVELVFDAPTREWAARRNAPTLNVFLYGIREDASRRQTGAAEELTPDGTVAGWRAPPRWFELAYLVTAWTNRPQDEHLLLSQALTCVISTTDLPPRLLGGSLAALGLGVTLGIAGASEQLPSVSDVWSALGGELRPSIDLRVCAPLCGPRVPAGPPAAEGLVVRAADTSADSAGARTETVQRGRRLRYDGTDTGDDGFAAARRRPEPPARRRRGGTGR